MRFLTASLLPCLLSWPLALGAIDIQQISVEKKRGVYRLEAESLVAAPPDFVYDVLADFNDFHRLSAGMVETRYLDPDTDGVPLGYTQVASCVWLFCKRFQKVERIWTLPKREMMTLAIPERSDFRHYFTRWRLEEENGFTRLRFEGTMEPDFWVPPLVGSWAVKRKLRLTAEEIGNLVEYLYATNTRLDQLPATDRQL